MARTIFADAIDYERVAIVHRRWWWFQPRNVVMAPTGNIHFHPESDLYRDDFAVAPPSLQGLFIHEMTHVWQTQRHGFYYLPLMRHPFCRYGYRIATGRRFDRYGLEQQAELVRHHFLIAQGMRIAVQGDLPPLPFGPRVTQVQQA